MPIPLGNAVNSSRKWDQAIKIDNVKSNKQVIGVTVIIYLQYCIL